MRIRSAVLVGAVVAAVLAPLTSQANHLSTTGRQCNQATVFPDRTITKLPQGNGSLIYVDDRKAAGSPNGLVGAGNGTWMFLESNNAPGLQTGGIMVVFEAYAHDGGVQDANSLGFRDMNFCRENGNVHNLTPDIMLF